jgi:membrane associated rhomboid family serine protease
MGHLLGNSLLFTVLGYFLAGYFGWRMFPLAAFAIGGLVNAISIFLYPPDVQLIGASGVVTWMGGTWLALYFLLNRQKTMGQRAMRATGVALMLFAPAETLDTTAHISHQTHLIGFILGVIYGFYYFWRHRTELRSAEVIEEVVDAEPLDGPANA